MKPDSRLWVLVLVNLHVEQNIEKDGIEVITFRRSMEVSTH